MFYDGFPQRKLAAVACLLVAGWAGGGLVRATDYPVDVEYTETLDLVLTQEALNIDGWEHGIDWIAASGDGQTVVFWTIAEKSGESNRRHFFLVDWDGGNLREITPTFEEGDSPRWPRLNHDGSRMFFMGRYHDVIRYIDTATGQQFDVVAAANDVDFDKPFEINREGTRVWFEHQNAAGSGCARYGIWYADVPGDPVQVFGLHEIDFEDYCNRNRLAFLGAADTGRVIASWGTYDYCGDCNSMFVASSTPLRAPDEQVQYVFALQDLPHRQISRDGTRALYHRGDPNAEGAMEKTLELVNLDTRMSTVLMEGATGRPAISPDGNYVRFNSPSDAYATLMDVSDGGPGPMRDTLSWYTTLVSSHSLTDICEDDLRWFGRGSQDWGAKQKIYRIDCNPLLDDGEYGDCPRIDRIAFSAPMLLHDESTRITALVSVSDPQGLDDIDWVVFVALPDYGRESVEWDTKGRETLSGGADSSGGYLSDEGPDGELGDAVAGDGIFTFDRLYTRAYCDFWAQYADRGFPLEVPIRVIVKDKSDNYTFADAQLLVTDDPADIPPPDGDGDDVDGGDEVDGDDGVDDDDGVDGGDDGTDDGVDDGDDGVDDDGVDVGDEGDDGDDGTIQPGGGDDVDGDTPPPDGNQPPLDDGLGGLTPTINVCPTTAAMLLALTVAGLLLTQPRRWR